MCPAGPAYTVAPDGIATSCSWTSGGGGGGGGTTG
eukprot:CAMPEP_0182938698 /NCGR_PEP_ID=MMETSP0105_2-20130417/44318_1 /TAXON_ID=81532 ORGANISM="Acanthoeca-like sp., Strain 10tr" /NCGR_SAMPLE_ID=MMETSP0105_2 /ASSEMBLY_ACC=CAM_ASM_000205 /LENGTH=34 /DNA_ID= /DNA_START= /DNA_END= /DNA_ORIENTATION=